MSVGHGTIDGVTSTASTVERAFGAALYDDTDTGLDTGASLLAADPAADAELARRGEEFVAMAWRRGWQPADVVRLVRRELEDGHVRLAAALIRAQAGRDRPRGRRWTAQLAELPEGAACETDRFAQATTALELYRLLLRLPALEPLEEQPRRAPGPGASRIPARIRALLAKAEATGYPEEAEALSAKAQELMARHSVDEALLAAEAPAPDAPGACRIGVEPPYEQAKAVLLDAVAGANNCRAVWNEPFGFSTVVGFEADLEAVELLYTSLLVQATHAMTKAEAAQRAGGRKRTKTFRQSFLAAYAHRVGDRLATAAETQVGQDLLPVLATRELAVTDRLQRLFPETTTTRLRGVTDAAGWTEGARAADRARVGSRPGLQRPRPGDTRPAPGPE
ncbi:aromatic acid decarboxylase [Streptomyces incarnatus]|uniref:Aromatic acid decarboxylase n=1 Tax=Streptomyces incarnatus TaxID=665007 RepID=A0ABM5TL51_9ACTN|nr:aromatic acid decarboxylase [Streptomyces incarnatus]